MFLIDWIQNKFWTGILYFSPTPLTPATPATPNTPPPTPNPNPTPTPPTPVMYMAPCYFELCKTEALPVISFHT